MNVASGVAFGLLQLFCAGVLKALRFASSRFVVDGILGLSANIGRQFPQIVALSVLVFMRIVVGDDSLLLWQCSVEFCMCNVAVSGRLRPH